MIMTSILPGDFEIFSIMGLKNIKFIYTWNVPPKAVSTPRSVVETYA